MYSGDNMNNFRIKNRKVYKMSLTTLSPIFINSGEVVNKAVYAYNHNDGIVNIVDRKKLISFLKDNCIFDIFLQECINGEFDLTKFFIRNNIKNYFDLNIYRYSLKTYSDISEEVINDDQHYTKLHDINTFIKSDDVCPYIPGSSIKGAIRTAVIYGEVLNSKYKYVNIFDKILKEDHNTKITRGIEREILNYKIKIKNMFRNMQVSDTNDIDLSNLYVSKRHDVVTHENEGHDLPIFMEVLKPGVTLYFNLIMDKSYSINDLLEYFNGIYNNNKSNNTFYHDYCNLSNFLQEKIECKYPLFDSSLNMEPNIFIGGVNGFLTKSIIYAIRKNKEDNIKITSKDIVYYMKKYFDKKFTKYDKELKKKVPLHDHKKIDNNISPRSLRLVKINKNDFMGLGMCTIKVEEELC